jgi:hypothetical protein
MVKSYSKLKVPITESRSALNQTTIREWQMNIPPKLRARRVLLPYLKIKRMGTMDPRALAIPTKKVPILALIPAPAKICEEYRFTTHIPLIWLKN